MGIRVDLVRQAGPALLVLGLGACTPTFVAGDLEGTWVGRDHTLNARGKSLTDKRMVLEVDADGMVRGSTSWSLVEGAGGNHVTTQVDEDSEPVLGSFDPASGTFYLVETEEVGFWHGKLLGDDRARLFLVQPGPRPVSSFVEMSRESAAASR